MHLAWCIMCFKFSDELQSRAAGLILPINAGQPIYCVRSADPHAPGEPLRAGGMLATRWRSQERGEQVGLAEGRVHDDEAVVGYCQHSDGRPVKPMDVL